jgi:hypothetical protein
MKVYKGTDKAMKRAAFWSVLYTWGATLLAVLFLALLCGCTAPAEVDEPSPASDEIVEVEPLKVDEPAGPPQSANRVEGCTVTYYCCELRPHICGTGDGAHIDLAVATHDEALDMGVQTATVYWLEG